MRHLFSQHRPQCTPSSGVVSINELCAKNSVWHFLLDSSKMCITLSLSKRKELISCFGVGKKFSHTSTWLVSASECNKNQNDDIVYLTVAVHWLWCICYRSMDKRELKTFRSIRILESFHFGRRPMGLYSLHLMFCLSKRINAQHTAHYWISTTATSCIWKVANGIIMSQFMSDLKLHFIASVRRAANLTNMSQDHPMRCNIASKLLWNLIFDAS